MATCPDIGGQTLAIDSRSTNSPSANGTPDEAQHPPDDSLRQMRSEVNVYASTILIKLLSIANEMPRGRRGEVQGIEREIHQMLAFIDPDLAASLDEQSLRPELEDDTFEREPAEVGNAGMQVDERIEALINQAQQVDAGAGSSTELLHDLRATLDGLRDDVQQRDSATTEALQSLTATTRSLHYTITALAARSEQVTDLTGIAAEQLHVGVWKYALIAGLSSGAIVAAIVAFIYVAI
jgi:hypothetical protein